MNLLKFMKSHSSKRLKNPRKVSTVKMGFTLIVYYAHYSIFVKTFKGIYLILLIVFSLHVIKAASFN